MMTASKYSFEQLAASYIECLQRVGSNDACCEELLATLHWPTDEREYAYAPIDTGFESFDIDFNLTFYQQL